MPYPVPVLTRLEYLSDGEWVIGHHGIALLSPERYVERLSAKGKVARATVIDTGVVYETACPYCGEPCNGGCLI